MSGRAQVIAIFGPTGIGKTAVAIALADQLRERGEDPMAISADALQVYRGLETLSGAATPEEQARLEHRLLGIVPATEAFSVGEFMPLAHAEIDDALAEGRRPIVVGGTGLYLRAALTDLDLYPPPPAAVRARWTEEVERRGSRPLQILSGQLGQSKPSGSAMCKLRKPGPLLRRRLIDLVAELLGEQ